MNVFKRPVVAASNMANPTWAELREMARIEETTTVFGSPRYISRIRSRSAKFTDIVYDEPTPEMVETINNVMDSLRTERVIRLDRMMCLTPEDAYGHKRLHCRFYVLQDFARIAYMWGQTLFDLPPDRVDEEPDLTTIMVPKWRGKTRERWVLVDPHSFTTFVLGSDYMGEIKKSFLRMAMYHAKLRGMLGLHAGSKIIRVRDVRGRLVEKGVLLFGLSGTGKTTLTCHHHFLSGEEGVVIRQDDVVLMRPDAYCYGTEDNFYLKTDGLEPESQPLLYRACTQPHAMLENVWVNPDGTVDFDDGTLTTNGRAIAFRRDMVYTDGEIDLPCAHIVVFITRSETIVPPVAKLSPEQAGAFFMLGESIETSAGDPAKAGQSVRCVGTNPFIIGPESDEGNIFMNFLRANPQVECFVMNTGMVGKKPGQSGEKIRIVDSTEIIKQIARGGIEWETDPDWGYLIPKHVDGMDISHLDPRRYYTAEEYHERVQALRAERVAWLRRFEGLDEAILKTME